MEVELIETHSSMSVQAGFSRRDDGGGVLEAAHIERT